MNQSSIAAAAALSFFAALPVAAQSFEKNGMPCLAEICVGDGIAELKKVPLDKAKSPFNATPLDTIKRKYSEGELRMLREQYKGDLTAASIYLTSKMFDAKSLDALARVTAACTSDELVGTFTTASGNPTRVTIALTPLQGPTDKQQWTVTKLMRNIPGAVTAQQRQAVAADLSARYAAFDIRNTKNAKPGEARFDMLIGASIFGFQIFVFPGLDAGNRLKQHPLCGGTARVTVD